ncbi:hypothetical protein ACFQRL_15085 [Microbacterium fluvii]|uniref:Fungal lipase-like domain-containing protein n=1 Tax=Microbacterium fluvii TaxID=415215 RepID=A0ABW2HG58_9MICO|nr:hypothetical protein [Microbacterium fluvii]MCU4673918.1 hypothetical protein [Microbacterium fluvii]
MGALSVLPAHETLSTALSFLIIAAMLLVGAAGALVMSLVSATIGPIVVLVLGAAVAPGLVGVATSESADAPALISSTRVMTDAVGETVLTITSDAAEARDYGDVLRAIADQDAFGAEESTQIRVVAIRDEQGAVVSWRVQLPSTQNWSLGNTSGALNDARSDLTVSLFPAVQTQFERAAWAAMEASGALDSDAPIMLTGWSLGGMVAAKMAADPRLDGRVQSVVTAGAAIDKYRDVIDDDVRVTQFNNAVDPVHTLEFVGLSGSDYTGSAGTQWQTYRPISSTMHDAGMYAAAADDYLPAPRSGDEIFFAAEGSAGTEDVYIAEYTRRG